MVVAFRSGKFRFFSLNAHALCWLGNVENKFPATCGLSLCSCYHHFSGVHQSIRELDMTPSSIVFSPQSFLFVVFVSLLSSSLTVVEKIHSSSCCFYSTKIKGQHLVKSHLISSTLLASSLFYSTVFLDSFLSPADVMDDSDHSIKNESPLHI
jgi:hypothetical protein